MIEAKDSLPLDTRLLSEAIIELNISRHNVSVYPRNHPIVEKTLNKVFDLFQKLFELRQAITLAVAKDILIVDNHYLNKKNPVYRDFAVCLNRINIASVTFMSGLTKDELYSFHRFLSENVCDVSSEDVKKLFSGYNIIHVSIEPVDFSAFNLVEGESRQENSETSLWEKYVFGLLDGKLRPDDSPDVLPSIPPDRLAWLINRADMEKFREESYDRVIASYMRRSSERAFSSAELKNVMDFITHLRPELKEHFLSSAVNVLSQDLDAIEGSIGDTPSDIIIDLLNIINEQLVAIPEALKNILDKFSMLQQHISEAPYYQGGLIEDDLLLDPEITNFLKDANFKDFVSDSYYREIQSIIIFNAQGISTDWIKEFGKECKDEHIEMIFHQIILEIVFSEGPDMTSPAEFDFYIRILRDQIEQFIYTGQYKQILQTIRLLDSKSALEKSPGSVSNALEYYHSQQFISLLINSLGIMGRDKREDFLAFCGYYGEKMIPRLIEALIDESSQSVRRFLISLITCFGEKACHEAISHLNDERWFVQRNMLFILNECGGENLSQYIRKYCNHENPKVSFEAIKYLLKVRDQYGVESLRNSLRSESRDSVRRAIALSGTYRVKEVVPDLVEMLRKKSITSSNNEDKIPIVRALGQIGDPRALDIFKDILSEKSLLFRGSLDRLKEEIRRLLKDYPDECGRGLS